MIARLNPIIRGWAAYYRTAVSSETFAALDHYLWKLTYKWAKHSHPNKPARWIIRRYLGTFCASHPSRRRRRCGAGRRAVIRAPPQAIAVSGSRGSVMTRFLLSCGPSAARHRRCRLVQRRTGSAR